MAMNAKENRIMTSRTLTPQTIHTNDKAPAPVDQQSHIDPIDAANHVWTLRLWILCALVIVSYAVVNYLLNNFLPK